MSTAQTIAVGNQKGGMTDRIITLNCNTETGDSFPVSFFYTELLSGKNYDEKPHANLVPTLFVRG